MLRALILVLLIGVSGGVGYYFGYNAGVGTAPPVASSEPPLTQALTQAKATERSASRARSQDTPTRTPDPSASLSDKHISLPIANLQPSDILDTFDQARGAGERRHEATDIMAPRGTPIYAVDDGVVRKLFTSKPGGLTVYQYDPSERYVYYYAHLDKYAETLKEGQRVSRGDLIGYVGSTGNADPNAPHLHFAILQLGSSREWWHDTTPINPYPLFMAAMNR